LYYLNITFFDDEFIDPRYGDSDFSATLFAFKANNTRINSTGGGFELINNSLNGTAEFVSEVIDYSPQNTTGLIGHWIQDFTTAVDEQGSNDGSFNGGLASCNNKGANGYGYACDFDGTDDYINISDINLGNNISIALWFNGNIVSEQDSFIKKLNEYAIGVSASNTIQYDVDVVGGDWGWKDTLFTVSTGIDYYVVLTYDETSQRMYINGELVNTTTEAGNRTQNANMIYLATHAGASEWFDGLISNVQIYNRTLSAQEVWDEYRGLRDDFYVQNASWTFNDGDPNLRLYMNLNHDTQTPTDFSGYGNDGTINGTVLFTESGYFDGAFTFAAGANRIVIPADPSLNFGGTEITVASWVYPTSNDGFNVMAAQRTSYNWQLYSDGGGDDLELYTNGGTQNCLTDYEIPLNVWSHLAWTMTGTNSSLWVNGTLIKSCVFGVPIASGSTETFIGDEVGSGFRGKIDEVEIWSEALSQTELLARYNAGSPDDYNKENTNVSLQFQYASDEYEGAVSSNTSMGLWLDFEQNASTVIDKSGNGNTGNVSGATYANGIGNFYFNDGYYVFDGTNDYINVTHNESFSFNRTDNYTVELWFKTSYDVQAAEFPTLINKRSDSGRSPYIVALDSSDKLNFYDYNGASSTQTTSIDTVTDGKWHHAVMVHYSNSTHRMFLDGVLQDTSGVASGNTENDGDLAIGRDHGLGRYFNGSIDEVHIYNRSFSDDEVRDNWWRGKDWSDWSTTYTNNTLSSLPGSTAASFVKYRWILDTVNVSMSPFLPEYSIEFNSVSSNVASVLNLMSPANNSNFSTSNVSLVYNATDADNDSMTGYLYVNGVLNITNTSISNGSTVNNTIAFVDGNWNWTVVLDDGTVNTTTDTWYFKVDTTPPNSYFRAPVNNTQIQMTDGADEYAVNFSITLNDTLSDVDYLELYIYNSSGDRITPEIVHPVANIINSSRYDGEVSNLTNKDNQFLTFYEE
jgi:hypothetical protein